MKRLFLCAIFLPFAPKAGLYSSHSISTNIVEIRAGAWPMNLERDIDRRDTSYSLLFRDQQVVNEVVMDTLSFSNLQQLRYFEKALTTLKTGNNGDIAKFKDYTLKRADKKYEGIWYILKHQWSSADFRQPEADIMIKTIRSL